MVPISETEALYMADLIDAMPHEQRARVVARFGEIAEALRSRGLAKSVADPAERHRLGLEHFKLGLACPFLENESCSIYAQRPASCREYLVTSPAANCSAPNAENTQMVGLPVRVSRVLYRFGDGRGEDEARWMPLAMLLEWAAAHRKDAQPKLPGPDLLRNFANKLL